jgi:tripartite-type tricarboxylate transporter receptor subunit TctC
MNTVTKFSALLIAVTLSLSCATASAQTYPNRPIKFVVGYPPGGGTDIVARIVAQKVSEHIGQPVVVENKPGANAIIGADFVAKSAPDGYTYYVGGSGEMVFNPALYAHLPYDVIKDFVPVTMTSSFQMLIAANPAFPAKTMNDLVAMAKAKPGSIFYGYGASTFQVAAELFKKNAGVNIVPVAYKGSNASIAAAVGGQIPIVITSYGGAATLIKAGKLRALAMTGAKRSESMPDVPSTGEQGVPFDGLLWNGLYAPAGTPQPVIDKMYDAVKMALKDPELLKRYKILGIDTDLLGMPPAEFAPFFHAAVAKAAKDIKAIGLKAN